jgi:uncharacterized damage-inducible protein DinB
MEFKLWIERSFQFGISPELASNLLERIGGTPARLEEKLSGGDRPLTARPAPDKWSVQEHAGHLWDVEALWLTRFEEYQRGVQTLTAAEMTGRKTWQADHNDSSLEAILAGFRAARTGIAGLLEKCPADYFRRTARHPRLDKVITPVDLMFFIAEHDDHHLAMMTRLLRKPV